ncbi:hypothetical protein JTM12_41180, partial [Pseudomonas aeruginosa]|nr:hypothetical protein [Pseudomonas aeruginosa]
PPAFPFKLPATQGDFQVFCGYTGELLSFAIEETEVATDDLVAQVPFCPAGERLALVLEDEEDVRQTLCEQLHQLGWLTLETASGEEALQLLEASPDIALLISD